MGEIKFIEKNKSKKKTEIKKSRKEGSREYYV